MQKPAIFEAGFCLRVLKKSLFFRLHYGIMKI